MPVADNNPERRNIMVSSLCFIAYYLAGGSISNSRIRLQVVNIEFERLDVLAIIAWTLLCWFALRYWQVHRGKMYNTLLSELQSMLRSKEVIWFATFKTGKKYKKPGGFHVDSFVNRKGKLYLKTGTVEGGDIDSNGMSTNYNSINPKDIKIAGLAGALFIGVSVVKLSFLKPGIGSYFVPYALFVFAVFLGIYNAIL